ncbi:hypothetical protein AB0L40_21090, partial [Patulibacter sp. NPDC049589]|uniref:hypothetical protein n=1 Tax=Patulibacter sp. NPDC049589 TaxID=3154731 RepID=UPI00341F2DD4
RGVAVLAAGPRSRIVAVLAAAALVPAGLTAGPAAAQTAAAPATTATTTSTGPEITADQAGPGILLDAGDRVELAQTLAESTEETGVCFGYQVSLGGSGASDRDEVLSNDGPDRRPGASASCPKGYLVVNVSLNYTSSSSEAEDSADYAVVTNVPGLPASAATQRLKNLTDVDGDDLLGGNDDLALRNLTAALPLILDDAEPAEETVAATTAPNGDGLTGKPSSDWLRAHGLGIGIAVVLLLVAVGLVGYGLIARRQARKPQRPKGPSLFGGSSGSAGSSGPTGSGGSSASGGSSSTTSIP